MMTREAMQQALDALEYSLDTPPEKETFLQRFRRTQPIRDAIAALRQALEEKPVAYFYSDSKTPKDSHPWLHSTMVVLSVDRRPELSGETPLYRCLQLGKNPIDGHR